MTTLTFKPLIAEAWQLTKGIKRKIWLAGLYAFIVLGILFTVFHAITATYPELQHNRLWWLLQNLITAIVYGIFLGGIMMMGVTRARGETLMYSTWTRYAKYFIGVACVMFISAVLNGLPLLINPVSSADPSALTTSLFSLTGTLIFNFLFLLAVIVVIDQRVNPVKACFISAKLMMKNFKLGLQVYLFMLFILIISMALILIPLIWTMPFMILLVSLFYVRITQ
jgi:hypothetical protein